MSERQTKTPRQRAEETRDRAQRRWQRAWDREATTNEAHVLATQELDAAKAALEYANANPTLKTESTTPTA